MADNCLPEDANGGKIVPKRRAIRPDVPNSESREDVVAREPVSVGTITKPAWAEWNPDIFQQTLPGLPYMMPDIFLPAKDCANCLFHREDWRGEWFCYMFVTEPTGDKCGQFKSV